MCAISYRILILTDEKDKSAKLYEELSREGFTCVAAKVSDDVPDDTLEQRFDLALITLHDSRWAENILDQLRKKRTEDKLPTIALIPEYMIDKIELFFDINDFVIEPYGLKEMAVRIKRLCKLADESNHTKTTKCGDLIVDSDKCEVHLGGKEISLTFKEYELLKFLIANKGKVFTRDTLLNEVWGYDYYGGDRTVDVHIRRLRGKIEDPQHIFIDTVRNIGYKFREENYSPASEHGF